MQTITMSRRTNSKSKITAIQCLLHGVAVPNHMIAKVEALSPGYMRRHRLEFRVMSGYWMGLPESKDALVEEIRAVRRRAVRRRESGDSAPDIHHS